jgi:hypothetical protein
VLFAPGVTAQRAWVVAPSPGPGVDFTTIQAAIDAASDGDTVLVRAGTYDSFAVDGKALVVAADGGPIALNTSAAIGVANIAVNQSVVVRGFSVLSAGPTPLVVSACSGAVTIEDCRLRTVFPLITDSAAWFDNSERVSLIRCTIAGGATPRRVNAGLWSFDSVLFLYECTVQGAGGDGGFDGAAGALLYRSSMSAFGSTIAGGVGDAGALFGTICIFPPTNGGPALKFGDATSYAALVDTTLAPGAGGYTPPGCTPGNPGFPIDGFGMAVEVDGPDGSLTAPSPVRAGNPATLTFQGAAGYDVWLLASARQSPVFFAGCNGAIYPDLGAGFVQWLGPMPASGSIPLSIPVPAQLTTSGTTVYFQIALTSPSTGCFVGSPTALLVVASGL